MLQPDSAINSLHNKHSPGRYSTTHLIDLMLCHQRSQRKFAKHINSSKLINKKIDFAACFHVQHISTTANCYYQLLPLNE